MWRKLQNFSNYEKKSHSPCPQPRRLGSQPPPPVVPVPPTMKE
ncbi:unnamed protein product, partial [Allacma fusca]